MDPGSQSNFPTSEDIVNHYASGYEADRLRVGEGKIERDRSQELLQRFLPPAPATILDVGGGPGGYACWLARQGYMVHLIDITPLHVQQAQEASQRQPETPLASAAVGDARSLPWSDEQGDAVLLFGPLYHLVDTADRRQALQETYRVLKPGGLLIAVGISRFASTFSGLRSKFLKDPQFAAIATQDLMNGHHRNPTERPEYFMDTFFHTPEGLRQEIAEAGFTVAGVYGVEGPGWLLSDFDEWWQNDEQKARLLQIARMLETEPSVLGVSAHLIAVARKT